MLFGKKNTAETVGMIEMLDPGDGKGPAYIAVSYMVDEKEYTIKETVKMKSKPIKVGKTVVGQRRLPVMSWIEIGAEVAVRYNTDHPEKASLPRNKGGKSI